MTNNQDALRCAERLEGDAYSIPCDHRGWTDDGRPNNACNDAAAHISRLVAENEAATALVQQMLEAGKELNRFYSHIWDRVDGCAVIFPNSIPAFENAVEKHGEAITAASEWLGQKGETG